MIDVGILATNGCLALFEISDDSAAWLTRRSFLFDSQGLNDKTSELQYICRRSEGLKQIEMAHRGQKLTTRARQPESNPNKPGEACANKVQGGYKR